MSRKIHVTYRAAPVLGATYTAERDGWYRGVFVDRRDGRVLGSPSEWEHLRRGDTLTVTLDHRVARLMGDSFYEDVVVEIEVMGQ